MDALKEEITALGDKIRELKAASADKAAIGSAVEALNEAKKKYADQNGGIGVDGKPYEAPISKAEKKAKAKAEKASDAPKPEVRNILDTPLAIDCWTIADIVFVAPTSKLLPMRRRRLQRKLRQRRRRLQSKKEVTLL